jgi:nicotinamide mononucleotide transporter
MNYLDQIWQGAIGASAPEQIATALGVTGVWLAIRESLWNFPVGLAQVTIFGWVCFHGKLYSEVVLQALFFIALIYGWINWSRGARDAGRKLPVRRLSARELTAWTVGTLAAWLAWSTAMARFTDAALPYADGFVFAVSVTSQWLQARKALENWLGWLVANTAAIGVFWVKGYHWFAALYFLFGLMAWGGWRAWRRSLLANAATAKGAA